MKIKTGKGTKENHVSLDLPENMGKENILLTQNENKAKKRNKENRKKKRWKEKWQQSRQISYKKMDNNSSIMNIDANLKLSSVDGKTPNNCLTP